MLALQMTIAWAVRRERAAAEVDQARRAPALFKPSHVLRLTEDLNHATEQARRWSA